MNRACASIESLLQKYHDQEVTTEERSLVEAHLAGCPGCREEVRQWEEIGKWMKTSIDETVAEGDFYWVWQKVKRGIEEEPRPWWSSIRSRFDLARLLRKRAWVPAAAAAMVILLVAIPLLMREGPAPIPPSVVEYVESSTHNVMIFEGEKDDVTVIWLFEGPDKEASTS